MSMSYSDSKTYIKTVDEVFNACLDVLKELKFKTKEVRRDQGEILASTGMTLRSWGENVMISIKPLRSGTSLYIESKVKAQIVDYGKNRENVIKILTGIDRRLL